MPITARERAEAALAKKQAELDKAGEKLAKAGDKERAAKAAAEALQEQYSALEAERDHLANHPALRGQDIAAKAPVQETPAVEPTPTAALGW